MAKYLKFRSKKGAEKRSKELWGGKSDAVTQHLYEFVESPKTFGGSFLINCSRGWGSDGGRRKTQTARVLRV